MDEARAPVAQGRQQAAGDPQVGADAGGVLVQLLGQVRRAGQVEAAQAAGALVAVAGEGEFDEQAQPLADLAKLVREVEDATATQGIALLVDAHDHLAVQASQKVLERLAQDRHIGAVLLLAEAGAQNLVALLAAQLVEELVEAEQLVGLAQHQVDRQIEVQGLLDFLQARAHLASQRIQRHLVVAEQRFHRNRHHHAIQRPCAAALAQQAEQGRPGAPVDLAVGLGQVAPGGVDQDAVVGEVPVAVARAGGVAGQLAVDPVDREFQSGKVQQAGLAASLRADQQVPGQLVAPALAATAVQAGGLQGAQGVLEAAAQFLLFVFDQTVAAQALLALVAVLDGLAPHSGAPADEDHRQPPDQEHQADAQQPRGRAFPELVVGDRQQRPDEPHQQCRQEYQQQRPDPRLAQEGADFLEEVFHFASLCLRTGLSCRRIERLVRLQHRVALFAENPGESRIHHH